MRPGDYFKRKWGELRHKMVHEKASPEYIARGWALGMFCGCFIPFGFQLYISIPVSFLIKGSKIGATVATLITNPVTIFFIYPIQCWVGARIIGRDLGYQALKEKILSVTTMEGLWNLGGEIFASFFVGAAILTAIMTPLTYFGVLNLVKRARKNNKTDEIL